MTAVATERLYGLLPAIYRIRDEEQGGPLRTLLGILEGQLHAVEGDIGQLYKDWFIETCQPSIVPYIADLLGVRGFPASDVPGLDMRAFVANTIAYRRRKGTVAVLEELSRDVTGWPAHAAEFFQRLATTQYLNHLRLANPATVDVRDAARLELLQGPFDTAPHTIDVRRIEVGRGRYNIPNVGLFLWRLRAYPIRRGEARPAARPADGRYRFDPLGRDIPLFSEGRTEPELTHLSQEIDVPAMLRCRALYDELEAYRRASADGSALPGRPHFGDSAAFRVYVDNEPQPVPSEQIAICDLSQWDRPPESLEYPKAGGKAVPMQIRLAVDPVLGRIAFPAGIAPSQVLLDYAYGFSSDMGGGPYNRYASVLPALADATWLMRVSKDVGSPAGPVVDTLGAAIKEWNSQLPGTFGVIAVLDSRTYEEELTGPSGTGPEVEVPDGSRLLIVAAKSAYLTVPSGVDEAQRPRVVVSATGVRPVLLGNLNVEGTAPRASLLPGTLILNGLWIEGTVSVQAGNLGVLEISHCSLSPKSGGLAVAPPTAPAEGADSLTDAQSAGQALGNERLTVRLEETVCGPVSLPLGVPALEIHGSIVDAEQRIAIEAADSAVEVLASTIFGSVIGKALEASNSIFMGPVQITRTQEGCVRFCSLPADVSQTPRRYRCQPDLGLSNVAGGSSGSLAVRFRPVFTSDLHGKPGYAQLGAMCPHEIQTGADDESEMGAFHLLMQPQREASLRLRLKEYLPTGMEAGLIHVT